MALLGEMGGASATNPTVQEVQGRGFPAAECKFDHSKIGIRTVHGQRLEIKRTFPSKPSGAPSEYNSYSKMSSNVRGLLKMFGIFRVVGAV